MEPHEIIQKIEELGYTQPEIAKLSGVSQPTVNRIANQKSEAAHSSFKKLLSVYESLSAGKNPSAA